MVGFYIRRGMAEAPKKKRRVVRKSETVREQAVKSSKPKAEKKRRVRGAAKKAAKPLKGLRFLRYIIPPYFRNSWQELKKVTWPGRKETWQLTLAVFMFAIVFGLLVGITDYGLDKVFKRIFLNL